MRRKPAGRQTGILGMSESLSCSGQLLIKLASWVENFVMLMRTLSYSSVYREREREKSLLEFLDK